MKNSKNEKIGIGMYTVHKSVEQDLYKTFCGLGQMGYQGIEFYGEPVYNIDLVKNSLKDSSLQLTGWHMEWANLQEDKLAQTISYLHQVDCPIAIIPCLGGIWNVAHGKEQECKEVWLRYIEQINHINKKLGKEGIRLGYHNHAHEFELSYDQVTVFEMLFAGLDDNIIMEFDSGNCIEGGGDPISLLKKYETRDIILHAKPYGKSNGFDTVLGELDDLNPWDGILEARKNKFLWLLIESENEKLAELTNADLCIQGMKKILGGI